MLKKTRNLNTTARRRLYLSWKDAMWLNCGVFFAVGRGRVESYAPPDTQS